MGFKEAINKISSANKIGLGAGTREVTFLIESLMMTEKMVNTVISALIEHRENKIVESDQLMDLASELHNERTRLSEQYLQQSLMASAPKRNPNTEAL